MKKYTKEDVTFNEYVEEVLCQLDSTVNTRNFINRELLEALLLKYELGMSVYDFMPKRR